MTGFLKEFYYEEEGMAVVEIVIIIAVLVAIAIIFRKSITNYAKDLMQNAFDSEATEKTSTDPEYTRKNS